jgi:hypothetical protein
MLLTETIAVYRHTEGRTYIQRAVKHPVHTAAGARVRSQVSQLRLWWTKCRWGRFYTLMFRLCPARTVRLCPARTVPRTLHKHNLTTNFIRRTSGRNLEPFQKSSVLIIRGAGGTEGHCHITFINFRVQKGPNFRN